MQPVLRIVRIVLGTEQGQVGKLRLRGAKEVPPPPSPSWCPTQGLSEIQQRRGPSLHSQGGSVVITHSPHFLLVRKEPGRGSIKRSNINTPPAPWQGEHKGQRPPPNAGQPAEQHRGPQAEMGLAMEHGGPYSRAGGSPRDCWYYLRYFFLFVSLIQFLIILGLVLFMVYGNVHVSTESNLQATERRAESLYNQVVELTASQANLSKDLNLTSRAKETTSQMLLGARRDLDRINASFRQCQADLVRPRARRLPWALWVGPPPQSELPCLCPGARGSHRPSVSCEEPMWISHV